MGHSLGQEPENIPAFLWASVSPSAELLGLIGRAHRALQEMDLCAAVPSAAKWEGP